MKLNHQIQSGNLRLRVLEMYFKANAGHIGCSLSCIDLMIASLINNRKENEVFLLSKGHAAAALYACLNEIGEISDAELETFYKNGTVLPAHPAPNKIKGIPFATGSLGHGLPIGTGIAQANKILVNDDFTYVLMSDGETNEGTTWEAGHYAVANQLDNLIVLVDKNGLQGFGKVTEANGHDVEALTNLIADLKTHQNGKPKMIIANTVKGKGVSYMENRLEWHYLPMKPEQYELAVQDIKRSYFE
ncbi:MAG: transketolase [Spirosomaceae bacterium]|nr:transketolase [Spirosomataceae bacterium]